MDNPEVASISRTFYYDGANSPQRIRLERAEKP